MRKKVLVLGGNFGGLTAALAVRHELDGDVDVRRALMRDVMHANCKVAHPRMLAAEAVHIMETFRITALPVVLAEDDRRLVGALNVHDLLRAGVM